MNHHINQRLSLRDEFCTVRYIGSIAEKPGEWLGVEWDDSARGKHDGSHKGKRYFQCRASSPTAASFLHPRQAWDPPRTFLQALRDKYMATDSGSSHRPVHFSSKQAEEVGFDKFANRQKDLHGIHSVVLDHMRIHIDGAQDEAREITTICGHVTSLDLGSNLFEKTEELLSLIACLPKLKSLTLDGNRFAIEQAFTSPIFSGIKTLSVSNMLLNWDEVGNLTTLFPNISTLIANRNGLEMISTKALPMQIQQISLTDNAFKSLSSIYNLSACQALDSLNLRRCSISTIWTASLLRQTSCLNPSIRSLDLRDNAISVWTMLNDLQNACPQVKHLQVSGNPLYQDLKSVDGKILAPEDGWMLTLARIPQLETLNYSKITEKEKLNAETYYLSQIAAELAKTPSEQHERVLSQHPRWSELREEYGEPATLQTPSADDINPNSLAARLVQLNFVVASKAIQNLPARSWSQEIPKSCSVYALLGMVGKKLGIMPLRLRLTWETDEQDPAQREKAYEGPEWWDSSDDEDVSATQQTHLVHREVHLAPSTRPIGTYFEGRDARIRVETGQF